MSTPVPSLPSSAFSPPPSASAFSLRPSPFTLLLLALCIAFTAAPAQTIGQAQILEQAGQFEAALDTYRSLLAREPANPHAWSGLRRLAVRLERFDVLDSVSAALAGMYPERTEFALGRVEALLGRDRTRDAVAAARRLLERRPNQVIAVADLFERSNALDPAVELLLEHRSAAGEPVAGRRLLELYERQQRHADAARELTAIVAGNERAAVELLPRLREYGAHSGWRAVLAEVRRLPAGRLRSRAEALVLLGAGRELEAAAAASAGLNRDELHGLAHEAEATGALRAALALYEELGLPVEQARVLRELGRVDDALVLLRRDGSPRAAFELAQVERLVRNNYPAAAEAYAEILRREPDNAAAAWGLASSRLALGDTAAARQALLSVNRPADSLLAFRARLAFYSGSADSLRAHSNQLLARYPTSRHVNDALELVALASSGEAARPLARAMLAHETGRSDSALAEARRLAGATGTAAEHALLFAARMLADLGRPREAYEALDSFPDRFPASPRRARALFEQTALAEALQDRNLRLRLLEALLLEYPDSPYAFVGRADRAALLRPPEPTELR